MKSWGWMALCLMALGGGGPSLQAAPQKQPLEIIQRQSGQNEIALLNNRFRIDYKVEEITLLFFRKRGTPPVILVRPDGSKMYASQGVTGEVEWYDEPTYDIIKLKNPMPGPWQAVGQILPESKILVLTDIALEVDPLPELLFRGELLKVTARLLNGGEKILSQHFRDVVTLDVDFISTNNADYANFGADTQNVAEFRDDGQGMDAYPGDAVFTGEFKLDFVEGQWRPEFYLTTPILERKVVAENLVISPVPVTFDTLIAKDDEPHHVVNIVVDDSKIDPSSLVLQGMIYYPNGEEQGFNINRQAGDELAIKVHNYDWGYYKLTMQLFATDITGREFQLTIDEVSFEIDKPIEYIAPVTVEETPKDTAIDLAPIEPVVTEPETPPMSPGLFWGIVVGGNLLLILVGAVIIRVLVLKKPLIPAFKKAKKTSETQSPSDEKTTNSEQTGRKSNDSGEILNLSMPDD